MKAMALNKLYNLEQNQTPLELTDLPDPVTTGKEILVNSACGVCHTELDEIEGKNTSTTFTSYPGASGHWKNRRNRQ
jgi:propanol-preferring alcohol dehydrogenase